MRILQIDDDVRCEIKRVKEYAVEHIVDKHQLSLIKSGDAPPVGDNPEHLVHIHDGYRIIYSVDKHPDNGKLYHHVSISVDRWGKAPHKVAVNMILDEFGLKPFKESDYMYTEDDVEAVNILQEKMT